jgi:hypothetical protein
MRRASITKKLLVTPAGYAYKSPPNQTDQLTNTQSKAGFHKPP